MLGLGMQLYHVLYRNEKEHEEALARTKVRLMRRRIRDKVVSHHPNVEIPSAPEAWANIPIRRGRENAIGSALVVRSRRRCGLTPDCVMQRCMSSLADVCVMKVGEGMEGNVSGVLVDLASRANQKLDLMGATR